jgi:hypothetical protein
VDIAIEGDYERYRIMDDLSESSLPYLVDVVDPAHCNSIDLVEHIERVGRVVYER